MNSMGITNISPETNGGFNPASSNLTAAERAEINRMSANNSTNHYSSSCGSNWHSAQNWSNNGNTGNNMIMPRPNQQSNMMRPNNNSNTGMTTNSSQSISFTPETLTNMSFLPAYLSQYIGHWVRADFFIGETIEQRVGVLHDVGASYFILEAIEPQTLLVCDMFSVKFVTIILDDDLSRLARF